MGEKSRSRGCCGWLLAFLVLAVVVGGIVYAVKRKAGHSDDSEPVPGPPGAVDKKYGDALKMAMLFFDVQKSGKLVNDKIPWRGDSALKDGSQANLDLSKGMYDAGDNLKFGFPMAFTATILSWAILEYGDQMDTVNQLKPARESLKWITDYLVNAHPSPNLLYIQGYRSNAVAIKSSPKLVHGYLTFVLPICVNIATVAYVSESEWGRVGDPEIDHKCWVKPETMTEKRPLTKIDADTPGTEVAAETAAALASASLVFKGSDSTYSSSLLKHAKQLFDFGNKYRGSYSVNIPEVQTYYNSTGYGDELLWAATWLYHATGDKSYLDFANQNGDEFANFGRLSWFSWDNKLAGTQVLLSRLTFFDSKGTSGNDGLRQYRKTAENVICGLLPDSPSATSSRTDGGLIWVSQWNALQQPIASAFLATIYSDYMLSSRAGKLSCEGKSFKASDIRKFAKSQADYVLGDNPMKMSFLVGYGDRYPQNVHHRGASIPADADPGCSEGFKWLASKDPNPNIASGGLVGGPFLNETFNDSRNNSMQTEPTTYNSALLVGLLSGLVTSSSTTKSFS